MEKFSITLCMNEQKKHESANSFITIINVLVESKICTIVLYFLEFVEYRIFSYQFCRSENIMDIKYRASLIYNLHFCFNNLLCSSEIPMNSCHLIPSFCHKFACSSTLFIVSNNLFNCARKHCQGLSLLCFLLARDFAKVSPRLSHYFKWVLNNY